MIEIDVYLVPYGNREKRKQIAQGIIINDGTGTEKLGNYVYFLSTMNSGVDEEGRIIGHLRENSIFSLLRLVFDDILKRKFDKLFPS